MPVFTVHAPVDGGADLTATDKFKFVRDGFHFWAMIFGPLWLLWNRLWLALIGYLIFVAAFNAGLSSLGVGRPSIFFADLIVALLMGLEAARGALERLGGGMQIAGTVIDDGDAHLDPPGSGNKPMMPPAGIGGGLENC